MKIYASPGSTLSGNQQPVQTWTIIAPETGQIVHSALIEGQSVAAGESVVQLSVGDLDMQAQINAARIQQASWQAASAGLSPTTRSDWQVNRQKLASAISESDAIAASRDRLDLKAPFSGMIGDVEPGMAPGQWVARGERLGVAFAPGPMIVETYLYESDVKRVLVGNRGRFINASAEASLELEVIAIDTDATRTLPDGLLTTVTGGHVTVRNQDRQRIPEQAVYRALLAVRSDPGHLAAHTWRGNILIDGGWHSLAGRYAEQALAVILREAGL